MLTGLHIKNKYLWQCHTVFLKCFIQHFDGSFEKYKVQKYAYRTQNNDSVKSPYMLYSVGCLIDWELVHFFNMTNYLLLQTCKFAVNRINLKMLHALLFASRNYERKKEWKRKWIDFPLFASGSHLSRFGTTWLPVDICTASAAVRKGSKCLTKAYMWILTFYFCQSEQQHVPDTQSTHDVSKQIIKFLTKRALDVNALMLNMVDLATRVRYISGGGQKTSTAFLPSSIVRNKNLVTFLWAVCKTSRGT